jgi:hypothetical protein
MLAVGVFACGDTTAPILPAVDPFTITPSDAAVIVNGSLRFEARSQSGAAVPVFWRVANPLFGTIDADGLYRASCGESGTTQIRALAMADTTRVATATLTQLVILHPGISLVSLKNIATQVSAAIDSIAGRIAAGVRMGGPGLLCNTVVEGWLELSNSTGTMVLDHRVFPEGTTEVLHDFQWDTSLQTNGGYQLRARMRDSGNKEYITPQFPVVIRNP